MPLSTGSDRRRWVKYKTPFGPGLLIWRGELLAANKLPGTWESLQVAERSSGSTRGANVTSAASVHPGTVDEKQLVQLLESYFSGKRMSFSIDELPLDRSCWTGFRASVAEALAAVPYGKTITYAGLAAAAGHPGACRAVGNFMAANPYPVIIPCHRVVRGDGGLGNFSAGEAWKSRLLELEGLPFPGRG